MSGEELLHAEGADAISTEDLGQLLVRGEVLLVLGVLEIVLPEVGPDKLGAFGAAGLILANDISEVSRDLHGLGKSIRLIPYAFRHLCKFRLVLIFKIGLF